MIPINNSDTAWLIVSDYNQDHSIPYEDLREDVNSPNVSQWVYEHYGISLGNYMSNVGDGLYDSQQVGDSYGLSMTDGVRGLMVGVFNGHYVGEEDQYGNRVGGNW